MMIGRSDKSTRTWKSTFLETGEILDSKQGNVQKTFKDTFETFKIIIETLDTPWSPT